MACGIRDHPVDVIMYQEWPPEQRWEEQAVNAVGETSDRALAVGMASALWLKDGKRGTPPTPSTRLAATICL